MTDEVAIKAITGVLQTATKCVAVHSKTDYGIHQSMLTGNVVIRDCRKDRDYYFIAEVEYMPDLKRGVVTFIKVVSRETNKEVKEWKIRT